MEIYRNECVHICNYHVDYNNTNAFFYLQLKLISTSLLMWFILLYKTSKIAWLLFIGNIVVEEYKGSFFLNY